MSDDELLSAYLDDELSDAERAAAEIRLRDDPRARQLVAELRAVSAAVRALPREKLGEDLREAVLSQEVVRHVVTEEEEQSSARRWTWAAMAIAATFFLMVYMPQRVEEKEQLARVEGQEAAAPAAQPQLVPAPQRRSSEEQIAAEADVAVPTAPAEPLAGSVALEDAPAGGAVDLLAQSGEFAGGSEREVFQVHLSPRDGQVGPADFDRLLASHDIAVESDASGADFRFERRALTAKSAEKSEAALAEAELVMVEAPAADIHQLIAACSGDAAPWRSSRISSSLGNESEALALADESPAEPVAERGVAIALDGIHLPEKSAPAAATSAPEDSSAGGPQSASRQARGRAIYLGRGDKAKPNEVRGGVGAASASTGSATAETIRVLFILHPGAK